MISVSQAQNRKPVIASVVVGAGLTIAGWVVVANVGWQLMAGLTQALLCESRSRRPLECLPAWTSLGEIGRRSSDTLLALVAHSPAETAAAAMGGLVGGAVAGRRNRNPAASEDPLSGPIGIVPSPTQEPGESDDDPTPA
jgi:hypothetical protein